MAPRRFAESGKSSSGSRRHSARLLKTLTIAVNHSLIHPATIKMALLLSTIIKIKSGNISDIATLINTITSNDIGAGKGLLVRVVKVVYLVIELQ